MPTPDDRDLRDLTDRTRAEQAASARRRQRSLLAQAAEDGTFTGVLADLAERGTPVAVHTRAGRLLRGTIRSLGRDHLCLAGPRDEPIYVATDAITGVRPEPGTRPTVGDRPDRWPTSLRAVLVELAADRPTVSLTTVGGARIAGRLQAAGRDVVAVRDGTGTSYVPLAAVDDLTLP